LLEILRQKSISLEAQGVDFCGIDGDRLGQSGVEVWRKADFACLSDFLGGSVSSYPRDCMDCIWVYTHTVDPYTVYIRRPHTVDRHTVYIRRIYSEEQEESRDPAGETRGSFVGGGGVLAAAAARIQSGVLLGVNPCPLRGSAPPPRVPRQEFALEICGGPGGYSGGRDLCGAGCCRRCPPGQHARQSWTCLC
jgi:hypothetical protein